MTDLDKMAREMLAAECQRIGANSALSVTTSFYRRSLPLAALLSEPPGYVLVPAEPTPEMVDAAFRAPCSGHPRRAAKATQTSTAP